MKRDDGDGGRAAKKGAVKTGERKSYRKGKQNWAPPTKRNRGMWNWANEAGVWPVRISVFSHYSEISFL